MASREVAFWLLKDDNGEESVIPQETLLQIGLDTEEKQRAALNIPQDEELKIVYIRRPLGEHKYEIQQKCLDAATMMYNPSREGVSRFTTLVEKWNGFTMKPTEEAYNALPIAVVNYLDNILTQSMMPNAFNNPSFSKALAKWQKDSAEKNESPS